MLIKAYTKCWDKTAKYEGRVRYVGKSIVNITNVTQLIFNCNVIEANYIKDIRVPFIYNCPVNVPPEFRLSRNLNTTQISNIRLWIVDGEGRLVDLRDDSFIATLSLKIDKKMTAITVLIEPAQEAKILRALRKGRGFRKGTEKLQREARLFRLLNTIIYTKICIVTEDSYRC